MNKQEKEAVRILLTAIKMTTANMVGSQSEHDYIESCCGSIDKII